jgi:hypothetical protein
MSYIEFHKKKTKVLAAGPTSLTGRWDGGGGLGVFVKLYKSKAIHVHGWTGPECFKRLRFLEVPENRNMKVVRLSALGTGQLFPPQNIAGTHFC